MKKLAFLISVILSASLLNTCSKQINGKPDDVYQSTIGSQELGSPSSNSEITPPISSTIASSKLDLSEPKIEIPAKDIDDQSAKPQKGDEQIEDLQDALAHKDDKSSDRDTDTSSADESLDGQKSDAQINNKIVNQMQNRQVDSDTTFIGWTPRTDKNKQKEEKTKPHNDVQQPEQQGPEQDVKSENKEEAPEANVENSLNEQEIESDSKKNNSTENVESVLENEIVPTQQKTEAKSNEKEMPASILYALYKQKKLAASASDFSTAGVNATKPVDNIEVSKVTEEDLKKTENTDDNNSTTENNSEIPPADKVAIGECYGKVITPGEYKDMETQVLLSPATTREIKVPAVYKEVEEDVIIKEASSKYVEVPASYKTVTEEVVITPEKREEVTIPAKYKNVTEKVLISPEQKIWKKQDDKGEVMKLVVEPAKYEDVSKKILVEDERKEIKIIPAVTKKIEKQVIDQPAHIEKQEIPAVTQKIKKQVLVSDATTKTEEVPAQYKTEIKKIAIRPDKEEWLPVLCNDNIDENTVKQIQASLKQKGYDIKSIDGIFGKNTREEFDKFQNSVGYSSSAIPLKTIEKLKETSTNEEKSYTEEPSAGKSTQEIPEGNESAATQTSK